ncbi:acetoin utilization protein [Siccirubricoccus deserti]|uniref:Histone deacetylase family protein n=1 Tax=Siccirubricoccus deserti TaxID=2013562 RepID=A0A9X0QWW1_9PROT|nr:histone deacetylase family protein [Siccirubricoccus deserti]MBC4015075.1 histone deacetylase family protein [Siccirubricoccus deserti]GGC35819.1 acetoin utilization protein [Siccirubricoccus deserti]
MSVLLLTHRACLLHDPGDYHPECPDRLRAVLKALDQEEFAGLIRGQTPEATLEQLCRVHPRQYVEAILGIRPGPGESVPLDGDTIMSHDSAEAALRAAGAAVAAVDAVMRGEVRRAFCAVRPPGHHAEPSRPMGFCLFSNAVVAARHAQATHGVARVAIVDFDVHHGNGSQACVEADASILYASSHQWPLYPGTGDARERGAGNVFNAPLPPGADGEAFRAAWTSRLLPAVDAFAPELLVISAGFDAHARDPLAQLRVREPDFAWLTAELCAIAERHGQGRVVSLLEGGYDLEALATSTAAHVRALMRA